MKTLDAHAPERTRRPRRRTAIRAAVATTTALAGLAGATFAATGASAANPYERGPAPTTASIEATTGPFAVSTTSVSSMVVGFGGGKIYYPSSTTSGTFGAVIVTPGYTERSSNMSWYGPRIASQGFVVFTIDTNTIYDFPPSRANQMEAALDYLVNSSSVKSRVDGSRTAFMGHSMGGGGSLDAALDRPATKAIIPLTPWETNKNFSGVKVPTLIVGAENDTIAPHDQHAVPFYNSLPSTTSKVYVELNGASHLAPVSPNTTIAKFSIAWLKRWVDNDTRYSPFLCNVSTSSAIQEFRSNCPF